MEHTAGTRTAVGGAPFVRRVRSRVRVSAPALGTPGRYRDLCNAVPRRHRRPQDAPQDSAHFMQRCEEVPSVLTGTGRSGRWAAGCALCQGTGWSGCPADGRARCQGCASAGLRAGGDLSCRGAETQPAGPRPAAQEHGGRLPARDLAAWTWELPSSPEGSRGCPEQPAPIQRPVCARSWAEPLPGLLFQSLCSPCKWHCH